MKTIKIFEKDDNLSVGIYQDDDGTYLAMTYSASQRYKTLKGALKWMASQGYSD